MFRSTNQGAVVFAPRATRLEYDLLGNNEVQNDTWSSVHAPRALGNVPVTGEGLPLSPEASLPVIRENLASLHCGGMSPERNQQLAQELGRLIDLMAAMQRNLVQPERSDAGLTGAGITDQVERTLLVLYLGGGMPTLQQVADLFHLSPRSLRRRLARQNTSWVHGVGPTK